MSALTELEVPALPEASQERHLPAFRRCLARHA
jgi:hypothetical protein